MKYVWNPQLKSTLIHVVNLAWIVSTSALVGCGGGGGGDSSAPSSTATAEGAYTGTTTRSITVNTPVIDITNDLQILVLSDGQYWLVSSFSASGIVYPGGFITGQGTSNNGSFTSAIATDFTFSSPPVGPLTATYIAGVNIQGRISDSTGTVAFNASAIPRSAYDYSRAPSLSEVVGTWAFRDRLFNSGTLDVSATGSISGSTAGCSFTGTLTPHPTGKNLFVSSITFGSSPCPAPTITSTGVAFTSLLPDGRRQIALVGVIPSRTYVTQWVGTR